MENEKKLIDAHRLLDAFKKIFRDCSSAKSIINNMLCALSNAPAVDAVEVVRCKDCKHRENLQGEHCCPYYDDLTVKDDHFCAYGERRAPM